MIGADGSRNPEVGGCSRAAGTTSVKTGSIRREARNQHGIPVFI